MKLSKYVSISCLIIGVAAFLIILSAWATQYSINGGPRFNADIRSVVIEISKLPSNAKSIVGLFENWLPPKGGEDKYKHLDNHVSSGELLSGFLIIPFLNSNGFHQVSALNLSNKTVRALYVDTNRKFIAKYSDKLINSESRRQSEIQSRNRIWHPYLLNDGLLVYCIPSNDLVAVDTKTGLETWRIRGSFHHSVECDFDGNLWVCASSKPSEILKYGLSIKLNEMNFDDQILVKVSQNGKILKSISVSEILIKSGLEHLLFGVSNPIINSDPIHLNQISPISHNSGVFRKGQILVSLRNLSTIILLDPDQGTVNWYQTGPWMNQHCVMPVRPSVFSVLDNHSFASGKHWLDPSWTSKIIEYDINLKSVNEINLEEALQRNLKIPIEGRALPMADNGWVLEDCTSGTVIIIKNGTVVYKWSNYYSDRSVGITSWCRYISNEDAVGKKILQP